MQRAFFTILIVILVVLTIILCVVKPQMHKNILIYNSEYQIALKEDEPQKPLVERSVEVINKTVGTVKQDVPQKTLNQQAKNNNKIVVKQTLQVKSEVKKTNAKPVEVSPKVVKEVKPIQTKQEIKKTNSIENKVPPINTNNNVQKNQNIEQSEDIIKWNKWRSDIQNQIMCDVKLPMIQEGIIFKFSFDVDKYGKISNVKTWSENSMYTPYAIQYIAPVIRSYQGKNLLNFPSGSNRYTTSVEGGWKISKQVKYSTPQDFNDTEKLKKIIN